MSSRKPPWWRAFDKVERAIGEPLENAAASSRYLDVVRAGMKAQRTVGGAVGRVAGGAIGGVLRVANVPSRRDLRAVNRQLTALTGEVRALKLAQQQAQTESTRPEGARARSRKEDDHDA